MDLFLDGVYWATVEGIDFRTQRIFLTSGSPPGDTTGPEPEPKKILCSICGEALASEDALVVHTISVHSMVNTFRCPVCNLDYPNQAGLDLHHLAVHAKPTALRPTPPFPGRFIGPHPDTKEKFLEWLGNETNAHWTAWHNYVIMPYCTDQDKEWMWQEYRAVQNI